MLKTIAIKNLKPNPFRRLDEYPILREKVDVLKESIASTGFWGTIVGRPRGDDIEIAFGHHRLVALQEGADPDEQVEIIVRELTNEQMLQMMARENMEEWGTSAWVEMETIRSVIEAYGKGEIELPPVPKKTNAKDIQYACEGLRTHSFTRSTVAEFLGWTNKAHENGVRPNSACEAAFRALEMIDKGFLQESDLKGLSRDQMATLVTAQWSIYQSEMALAEQNQKEAEKAKQKAATASTTEERRRLETQAKVYSEQSEQHKTVAKDKAKDFGKETAQQFRSGDISVRDARKKAEEVRSKVERPVKIHEADDMADRLAAKLEHIANGDDDLSGDVAFLKRIKDDLSSRATNGLFQSFSALIARLERMQNVFKVSETSPRSHRDGTGAKHAYESITGGNTEIV